MILGILLFTIALSFFLLMNVVVYTTLGQKPQIINYANNLTGITFEYLDTWVSGIYFGFEDQFCKKVEMHCLTTLNPGSEISDMGRTAGFNIMANRGPEFEAACNCSNLLEFVRANYRQHEDEDEQFFFFNDTKTTIGENISAWKIDYRNEGISGPLRHFDILAVNNGIFYTINYYADLDSYDKFLPDITDMINSIRFLPPERIEVPRIQGHRTNVPNEPSFMK